MSRKAVIAVYSERHGEPMKPVSVLFDIPEDKAERETMLTALFLEYANDDPDEDITFSDHDTTYGDITVAASEIGVYLYVTFVE